MQLVRPIWGGLGVRIRTVSLRGRVWAVGEGLAPGPFALIYVLLPQFVPQLSVVLPECTGRTV